jgi:hypothetical protein
MATAIMNERIKDERCFYVVHPLDDIPEEKCNAEDLGPMAMTRSVKWSLMALRGYLVVMGLLVAYHVLDLAGLFGHHAG